MTDSVSVAGEELISSKRASKETGYTQDYIGQLARGASIAAKRVGGHWYISLPSLLAYKSKADAYKPQPPAYVPSASGTETSISFDGKDFISACAAAKLSGYHQDYVGQLARSGRIASRQIGNRWFIERESLQSHKNEKASLFPEVGTHSVGLPKEASVSEAPRQHAYAAPSDPFFTYSQQTADLLPNLSARALALPSAHADTHAALERGRLYERKEITLAPARHAMPQYVPPAQRYVVHKKKRTKLLLPLAGAMLTIVVVLTFGFTDLKERALYALQNARAGGASQSASGGSVSNAFWSAIERMEEIFSHELHYTAPRK